MYNYKLNSEEIQSFRNQNSVQTEDAGTVITKLKYEIGFFMDGSKEQMQGVAWDALKTNVNNYIYCLDLSSKLNLEIEETFEDIFTTMQNLLDPETELDVSKLSEYEEEKYQLEKYIATLSEDLTDSKNRAERTRCLYRISTLNRKISKINEYTSTILPQSLDKLAALHSKIDRLSNCISWFDNPYLSKDMVNRYVNCDGSNALFYYDDNGIPYAVYYRDSNILIDFSKGSYLRYDPETGNLSPISIFDELNVFSTQYGASQLAFSDNFEDLINDPLIWEEMQKYYPLDSFNSIDEAMDYYERYFNVVSNVGCGYAAGTNIIFQEYEGRETEFESTFGFPMYTVDNEGNLDFNYELMELKYYNYSNANKGYTLEQMERGVSLNSTIQDFFDTSAVSTSCKLGNLDDFLSSYGISSNATYDDKNNHSLYISDDELNSIAQNCSLENDYIVYGGNGWDLYVPEESSTYGDNSGQLFTEDGGGHYMMITGYTEDGNPIVSSWGEKFILDIKGNNTGILDTYRYYYVNFNN